MTYGFLTLTALGAAWCPAAMVAEPLGKAAPDAATILKLDWRTLWVDHIIFTRSYIVSTLAGLGDQTSVTARLMRNQDDIGAAIAPDYGDAAGRRLATLLREHISIAAKVVAAAKAGDAAGLKRAQALWAANGEKMADFLSAANPWWKRKAVAEMLSDHLATTTAEVDARLTERWPADIENFDHLHAHMLMFADYLADGLVRQFPERFKPLR